MTTTSSFRDLRIWQESMDLTVEIYRVTSGFPEKRDIRASFTDEASGGFSPSNIAEGKGHRSDLEFVRFLLHARGSLLELQTQILISGRLQYLSEAISAQLCNKSDGIAKGLNALISKFRESAA